MKATINAALNDPRSRYYFWVSDVLALATIVSVVSLVLETVPGLAAYQTLFNTIEWTAVVLFSVEYLARLWVSRPYWHYPVSFFGMIDLISIVPSFLGAGNLTFLKAARALRIIRLLRIIRFVTLSHLHKPHADESLGVIGLNALIFATLLLICLLLTGTLIYVFETGVEAFASIPAGMWWALQVFAGGIPVVEPLTALGSVVYVMARFLGFLILGVTVGVVGNVLRTLLLK